MGTQTMSPNNDKRHDTSALDDISEQTSGVTLKSDPAGFEANAIDRSAKSSGNPSVRTFRYTEMETTLTE
ncbi:hypothetical protein BDW60DRAFT_200466 [Aspergillus nidulans var. acristatus]